jgi:SAM-dependent methyltransferase
MDNHKEIFTELFNTNSWGSTESRSGMGSTLEFTENTRKMLPILWESHGIKRILDVACGDFNWMQEIVSSLDYYKGTDIVEDLIDLNKERYQQPNKIEFGYNDIINDFKSDGQFDAIIAKDVLVHFPNDVILKVLDNFKKSGIKYMFLTHFTNVEDNWDVANYGDWRPINFTEHPFSMVAPLEIISEKIETYEWINEMHNDKTLSLWETN